MSNKRDYNAREYNQWLDPNFTHHPNLKLKCFTRHYVKYELITLDWIGLIDWAWIGLY